jgi:hypothetical protein
MFSLNDEALDELTSMLEKMQNLVDLCPDSDSNTFSEDNFTSLDVHMEPIAKLRRSTGEHNELVAQLASFRTCVSSLKAITHHPDVSIGDATVWRK